MLSREYQLIENYMCSCMTDSAHDREHIYRVLFVALDIASYETGVNYDVLIAACLLHDIGRKEQFDNPQLCHAKVGSGKAYQFLIENGWNEDASRHVSDCIRSHRYRRDNLPETLEAKILFDADKIDVTGAIGIARTLFYKGEVSEPLYSVLEDKTVLDGSNDTTPSFFQEYKYKLEKLYNNFYTGHANKIAKERQSAAIDFYNHMLQEVTASYGTGAEKLSSYIHDDKYV